MATQKVGYFIAGSTPTSVEQAEIDWLTEQNVAPYAPAVRSVLHNTGYGANDTDVHTTPEHFDLVASNGAEIPAAYAEVEKFTVPVDPQRSKKKSTATWPTDDDEPTKRGRSR